MFYFLFEELKKFTTNINKLISLMNTNHFQISSANLLSLHFVLLACLVKITYRWVLYVTFFCLSLYQQQFQCLHLKMHAVVILMNSATLMKHTHMYIHIYIYSQTSFIYTTLFHQIMSTWRGIQIIRIESIKSKIISRANANNVNKGGDDVQHSRTCLSRRSKGNRRKLQTQTNCQLLSKYVDCMWNMTK